jgi:hypothetical protein
LAGPAPTGRSLGRPGSYGPPAPAEGRARSLGRPGSYARLWPPPASNHDKRTGKSYTSWRFATFALPYFSDLQSQWYHKVNKKNIKRIPDNIEELLTPVALAYWNAGDGHYCKTRRTVPGLIRVRARPSARAGGSCGRPTRWVRPQPAGHRYAADPYT